MTSKLALNLAKFKANCIKTDRAKSTHYYRFLLVFSFCLAVFLLGIKNSRPTENIGRSTLVVGVEYGHLGDFAQELAQAFVQAEKIELEVLRINTSHNLMDALKQGRCDLVVQPTAIVKQQDHAVKFTKPIYSTRLVVLQNKKTKKLENPRELAGETVFIAANEAIEMRLKNLANEIAIPIFIQKNNFQTQNEIVNELANEKINYTVCTALDAKTYTAQYSNIYVGTPIGFEQNYGWVTRSKSHILLQKANAFIPQFIETKAYREIFARYFSPTE